MCANRHSFDVAKSGYVNLLQPQDRKSKNPGDSKEAVAARRRYLDRGIAEPTLQYILDKAGGASTETILDVGCGEGYYLGAMQRQYGSDAHGVDISVPAIDAAAKRYRDCRFVVANADRFLPYADGSFALVTSITSRMNAPEFRRVIRDEGLLFVVLPAPDDLIELREAVLGEGKAIDRTDRTIDAFSSSFSLQTAAQWRHVVRLDRDAIHDVMASSYRGLRTKQRERLEALAEMDVTMSRDVLLFTPL